MPACLKPATTEIFGTAEFRVALGSDPPITFNFDRDEAGIITVAELSSRMAVWAGHGALGRARYRVTDMLKISRENPSGWGQISAIA